MEKEMAGHFTAFVGEQRVASGELPPVARAVREALDAEPAASALVFDDATGRTVEVDLRGTAEDVENRLAPAEEEPAAAGPGRPKLGVVAREVTLLPRHWEWLNRQPGGVSVALRRLVEDARKANAAQDRVREAQEAAYRFMTTLAGDRPGYEEATRALFAGDRARFEAMTAVWPADVQEHARTLAADAFGQDA